MMTVRYILVDESENKIVDSGKFLNAMQAEDYWANMKAADPDLKIYLKVGKQD